MPKKKQKNDPPVRLGQLVALIIEVVQSLDREKAEKAAPPPVYHVAPHCDGCTCGKRPPNRVPMLSDCTCPKAWNSILPPPACPVHGPVKQYTATCSSLSAT
jgi:hypothetical protein